MSSYPPFSLSLSLSHDRRRAVEDDGERQTRASGGKRGCCVNGKGSGVQEQQQQRRRRRRRRRREGGDRDDMRESGVLLSSLAILGLLFCSLNISRYWTSFVCVNCIGLSCCSYWERMRSACCFKCEGGTKGQFCEESTSKSSSPNLKSSGTRKEHDELESAKAEMTK